MNRVLFASGHGGWETPRELYDEIDREFGFTLDTAASDDNALAPAHYTEADNALVLPWHGRAWCNPPYGRRVGQWVEKAYREVHEHRHALVVVMLLPARTDTRWFQDWAMRAQELRFIRGRLRFGGAKQGAPFPSVLVVFHALPVIRGAHEGNT